MRPFALALLLLILSAPAPAHSPAMFIPMVRQAFPQGQEFRPRGNHLEAKPDLCHKIEAATGTKFGGMDSHIPVFDVYAGGKRIGLAWYTEVAKGSDFVGVSVGVDLKGRIVGVALDAAPPTVDNQAFLGQFKGKTAKSKLKVGQDLKAAPGDPGLSQRIAAGVRKSVALQTALLGR